MTATDDWRGNISLAFKAERRSLFLLIPIRTNFVPALITCAKVLKGNCEIKRTWLLQPLVHVLQSEPLRENLKKIRKIGAFEEDF